MSRIRRISLAATAAAAVLAFAIPASASAISINGGQYTVSGVWSYFDMTAPGHAPMGVHCFHSPVRPGYGWGIAHGAESTPFIPPFSAYDPVLHGGCQLQDNADPDTEASPDVKVSVSGALMLSLTGLTPGQDPSSPRRNYDGELWLHSYSRIDFRPQKFPGCTVTIAGPQSVDLSGPGSIVAYDDYNSISLDASGAEFGTTKTAACPSRIDDSVMIHHPTGARWTLNGVTVTP